MTTDQLAQLLGRMVPPVDDSGVWEAIQARANSRQFRKPQSETGKSHRRWIRPFAVVVVAAVLLAGVGYGLHALMECLNSPQHVVVITDDPMSPSGNGSSSSVVDGVIHLSFGQIADVDELSITVTVSPTWISSSDSDLEKTDPLDTEASGKQMRSQYIISNPGSETRSVDLGQFELLGQGGHRYSPLSHIVSIEPGTTQTGRLDFRTREEAVVQSVAYVDSQDAEDLVVWGPDSIDQGPGYPVLRTVPAFRAEDVESIEEGKQDQIEGEWVTKEYEAAGLAVPLQKFIDLYEQTTLLLSEGYPTDIQLSTRVVFRMVNGGSLTVWIGDPSDGRIVIEDTRASLDTNPPSAIGLNTALANAYYADDPSETTTTSMAALGGQ